MTLSSFADLNDFVRPELRRIEALISRRQLTEAASALTQLGRSAPTDWRVPLIGIQLAEASGNLIAARAAAQRTHEMAPTAPLAQIELARTLSRDGEHERAVDLARQATATADDADELILSRAVAIGTAAREWTFVHDCLQKAYRANPDDLNVVRALGFNALCRQSFDEAIQWYSTCLEQDGNDELALSGHGWAHLQSGLLARAEADYARLVQLHPASAEYAYFLSLARGETPEAQPVSLVLRTVEGYASRFDDWVSGALGYYAPRRVAEMIREAYPKGNGSVLDLGCGTGMLAAYLGPISGSIVGVDLSKTMLDQAANRHYDRLHHCDLRDALRDTPDMQYEVIAACDVFIYLGKLDEHVKQAARILRPNGRLIATFEQSDDLPCVLRPTERFAHSTEHVQQVFAAAGLIDVYIEPLTLRHEAGVPVPGFIAVGHRPLQSGTIAN